MLQNLSDSSIRKLLIALAIYITALIASNIMGFKLMPFIFGSHLSVTVFMFPLVFLMTDIVGEVYGKKVAKFFVLAGIISTVLWILFSLIATAMPWAEKALWVKDHYDTMLGVSIRIAIASVIAFTIAEYQDVLSFFYFKATFGERWFWLRSNLSNLWSQLLDTVLFMSIAFYGVYETPVLISATLTWWLFKVGMGFLYTPLSYLGIRLLREKESTHAG
ncbi:MAG: queuosine precursor transporter [Minisyncoccia bacterium]